MNPDRAARPSLRAFVLAGACLGLALFGVESVGILRSGAVGIDVDLAEPIAAVMRAARPQLPSLLARVALVYVVAGAALALLAGALVRAYRVRSLPLAWTLFAAQWLVLGVHVAWHRAITRPALFDDLAFAKPVLAWLVDNGDPEQPLLSAALWLTSHLALGTWRRGPRWGARATLAAGSVAALVVAGGIALPRSNADHPLLVVIGIDAFRPDRLSALGGRGDVAPNLERFLDEATLFDKAFTPIAQTEPAWQSLLTARWPSETGVRAPLTPAALRRPLETFPARLRGAGFHTEFHTDCSRFNHQGPASGFSERIQPPKGAINFVLEKLRYRGVGMFADNALGARWVPELIDNRALAGVHDPMGYASRLARRIVTLSQKAPTLVAFHGTAAHFPGDPVYPYYRKFVDRREPLERRLRMHFSPIAPGSNGGWNLEGARALYDELLSQADAQVGTIFDALKRAGVYDRATIVVFSDHGESFHEDAPELAGATPVHGARLSEEENRILLAIKLPKAQQTPSTPRRVSELVRLIDIGPTLVELAGGPPLGPVDGVSLVPALRGEPLPRLILRAETGFTHVRPDVFDPGHRVEAPRSFEAYRLLEDGSIELTEQVHAAVLAEKDTATFDGETWLIESARADGRKVQVCRGRCTRMAARVPAGKTPARVVP